MCSGASERRGILARRVRSAAASGARPGRCQRSVGESSPQLGRTCAYSSMGEENGFERDEAGVRGKRALTSGWSGATPYRTRPWGAHNLS